MALRLLSALAACRLGAAALAKIAWQRRLAAEGSEGLELQLALPEEETCLATQWMVFGRGEWRGGWELWVWH